MIKTRTTQFPPTAENKKDWDKLLENINAYGNSSIGMADLIKNSHQRIIDDKLLPWLHD